MCERHRGREREREREYDIRLLCHDPYVTCVLIGRASRLLLHSGDFPVQEVRQKEREREEVSETEGGENSAQTISECERGRNRRREELAGKQ